MTDQLHAGPVSLDGIADRPGDALDAAAGSTGAADTPIFDGLLDRLIRDTGGLQLHDVQIAEPVPNPE